MICPFLKVRWSSSMERTTEREISLPTCRAGHRYVSEHVDEVKEQSWGFDCGHGVRV